MNALNNPEYVEKCPSCRGSGDFVSYAGRYVGPCFKCKGTGERTFKTSPQARKANRANAAQRKAGKLAEFVETDLGKFLQEVSSWNEFAAKMLEAVSKYGALTDNQEAACERMQAKHLARQAEKANAPKAADSGVDLSGLVHGMYSVPGGETRLKVAVQQGKAGTKWEGWTFVKDGAVYGGGQRYGTQRPGETYQGKVIEELKAILADPFEAMCEYGRLTSTCGACGRALEDEASVAAGIGPICAKKF